MPIMSPEHVIERVTYAVRTNQVGQLLDCQDIGGLPQP